MRFYMLIPAIFLLVPSVAFAQQRWERTYGGSSYDMGYFAQQTTGGGYIVTGTTHSLGDNDQVYLIKTDASGDTLWTRTYGGAGVEYGFSVQQTTGGYIIVGYTMSFGAGIEDVYLIKTGASGETLWTRTYGGASYDVGNSIQQTMDGGYIVAGTTTSFEDSAQAYLIKTDANGDTVWTRTYGWAGYDYGYSVQQTTDSGYIVAGSTLSFGTNYEAYLIKTDASGDTLWTRTYGGPNHDPVYSVQQTTDGGYIAAGQTNSFGNSIQYYLIKTNAAGDTLWTRTYGGTSDEAGYFVRQTADGGYVVTGSSNSFGNARQVYLVKTNSNGDTLWTRTYGGTSIDVGYCVQQTADLGYVVTGWTTSFGNLEQVYLVKTDAAGSVGVEERPKAEARVANSSATVVRGVLFLAGATSCKPQAASLLDASGRKVLDLVPGPNDVSRLSPGVYFVRGAQAQAQAQAQAIGKVILTR
jgi:hypothetical protein